MVVSAMFASSVGHDTRGVIIGLILGFVVLDIVVIALCLLADRGRRPPRN